jgi:hypothetical protein
MVIKGLTQVSGHISRDIIRVAKVGGGDTYEEMDRDMWKYM